MLIVIDLIQYFRVLNLAQSYSDISILHVKLHPLGIKIVSYFLKHGQDKSDYLKQLFVSVDKGNKILNMKEKGNIFIFHFQRL